MKGVSAGGPELRATKPAAASDLICAVRAESQGRAEEAVLGALRARFDRAHIEISEGELQRVARDIAQSKPLREA